MAVNFYNTRLVIVTLECGEFHQEIKSEKIERQIAVNFYNTLLVIVTVNYVELIQHTLCNFNGRLR